MKDNDAINIQLIIGFTANFQTQDESNFTAASFLKMNSKKGSIAKALNELYSSHLIDSDQGAHEAFIQDFFDESQEEEYPEPPSKTDKNEYKNYE